MNAHFHFLKMARKKWGLSHGIPGIYFMPRTTPNSPKVSEPGMGGNSRPPAGVSASRPSAPWLGVIFDLEKTIVTHGDLMMV